MNSGSIKYLGLVLYYKSVVLQLSVQGGMDGASKKSIAGI
jgi:hypothetical protein